MNLPLQERGGANIGNALIVPSSVIGNSVFRNLIEGDNTLVEGGEGNARLIGIGFSPSVLIYNLSGVVVGGQLVWQDGQGNETVLDSFAGVPDGGTAALSPNSKLGFYATLAPGEKLVLRFTPAPGYLVGTVASMSYQDFYRAVNTRVNLDTSLKVASEPLPGRSLQPANLLSSAVILNLDTIPHTVDIYANDGVSDLLLLQNAAVAADASFNTGTVGPGNGQSIKAVLKEALSAPEKRVIYMPCYVQYDA